MVVRPFTTNRYGRKLEPGSCCARMFRDYDSAQCKKPTKITIGTLEYCGLHNPVTKKVRDDRKKAEQEARFAEFDRNRKAARRAQAFRDASVELVRAIALGHNDPRHLCSSLLDEYPEYRRGD